MPQEYNYQKEAFLLSRNNYEKWFRTFKYKAQSKGYFYVAETTKENFAWIGRADGPTTSGTHEKKIEGSSKSQENASKSKIDDLTSRFEKMGGSWNIDKAESFDQDTAKFFSHLTKCLGDDDQETFEEFTSAKEIWDHLRSKYCRTNESTVSTYISKIQSFPENFDVDNEGIEKAWAKLNSYKRKLTAADTGMRHMYPARALFLILTKALPSTYTSIIDGFRTNPSTTIDERITILLEKEDSLRSLEHAHPAYKQRPRQDRRYSDVSMPDAPANLLCYMFDGDDHVSRDCPYAKEIKEYGVALRKKYERRNRKLLELKRPEKRKSSKTDVAASKKVDKSKSTRKSKISRNGYVAQEDSDVSSQEETDEETSSSCSDSDHLDTQKVMLSKALIRDH